MPIYAAQDGAAGPACLTALRVALTAAWVDTGEGHVDGDLLRRLLSAACGSAQEAVRAAAVSAVPAAMASISRLSASSLSQVNCYATGAPWVLIRRLAKVTQCTGNCSGHSAL